MALAIVSAAYLLIASAYWPGIMIDDTRWQYQQVVDNAFEDWHPPIMAWIWRRFALIEPGPGPMLLLQLALGWTGLALGAAAIWKRGHPRIAIAIAGVACLPAPLALAGTVTKDWLMAGTLLSATGLILWRNLIGGRAGRAICTVLVLVLLLFAAALRLNAVFACVPLAIAALPRSWTDRWSKFVLAAAVSAALCLAVGPIINRLVQAEKTGVELSLIIFDLGGITEHSRVSVFPDLGVADPVSVNRRCYDPTEWDSYSSWAKRPCPIGFDAMQAAVDDEGIRPTSIWLHAIASRPLAYVEHRLTHFNLSTWFLVPGGPWFTAWSQSVDNPWHFTIGNNAVVRGLTELANAAAETPLGWPIFWIAVGLASVVAAIAIRAPPAVVAIAASPPLYGLGFLLVGVAVGMRYYLWTISGGAVAALVVASELAARADWKRQLRWPSLIVAVPTLLAIGARVFG